MLDLTGEIVYNYTRDTSAVKSGSGFLFAVSFGVQLNTGSISRTTVLGKNPLPIGDGLPHPC
jgi:hypothetical protein